jgi:hypothetical protein
MKKAERDTLRFSFTLALVVPVFVPGTLFAVAAVKRLAGKFHTVGHITDITVLRHPTLLFFQILFAQILFGFSHVVFTTFFIDWL